MRALLCVLLLAATPAAATVPIMVAPFGDRDAQKDLFNALELELEVEADLVLSDAAVLFEDLMISDLSKAPNEEIAASLKRAGQAALIQAAFVDEDLYATVYVLRASDGNIVFAQRVEVDLAIADARPSLVDALVEVLKDVEVAEAVSRDKLVELKIKEPAPRIVSTDPPKEDPPKEEPPKEEPPDAGGPNRFSALRAAVTWAPALTLYQACSPSGSPTPFLCDGGNREVTAASLISLAGAGLQLEYYPREWIGLDVEASGGLTQVSLQVENGDNDLFSPSSIGVRSASVNAALVLRMLYSTETFGIFTGLRLGYHLEVLSGDDHVINIDGVRHEVAIVPVSKGQLGLLGFGLGLSFNDAIVVELALDVLAGLYDESPRIWDPRSTIGWGGRARLGVDVELGGGVFLTAGGAVVALHAQADGTGTRETLDLAEFDSGHARLIHMNGDVGLGWRF